MARKKRAGKKRRKRASVSASSQRPGRASASERKVSASLVNLVVFALLSAISYILYQAFTDETLVNFFWISSLVTGFIAVAFLIAFLLLKFMKGIRR